ncbi:acyl carrier protein [Abyssisolibacter fermentans]|uniref:acyl carrier protein n=1 Tax=Abyssisolibacter fermentans TaxID=1766203 RepID=UPI00082CDB4E|nr:acyl carrier protein [Abyssisolibacter fermentans]
MVYEKLVQIIEEQLSVSSDQISKKSSFQKDLDADSLDVVELIMAIEDEFDLEIPDDEAEHIKTVQDAVTYIEQRI